MTKLGEEYPRVKTCVNGWCPERREDCQRCDKIVEIIRAAYEKKYGAHGEQRGR